MTINRTSIEDDLSPILASILGEVPCISELENAIRPTGAYVSYRTTYFKQIGFEEITNTDSNGISTFKTTYNFRIKFRGINDPTSSNIAKLAFSLLNDPIILDSLIEIGFCILNPDVTIQDEPSYRNGKWEQDDIFYIDVNYTDTNTVDTSYIGSTEITGNLYDPGVLSEDYPDTDPSYTITIDIP